MRNGLIHGVIKNDANTKTMIQHEEREIKKEIIQYDSCSN